MTEHRIHAHITGPIIMIGFGSIGKGTLPLIERHFAYDRKRFVIVDPEANDELARKHGVRFVRKAITKDNYEEVLTPLLTEGGGQGFCVNLSVDTGSVDLMRLTRRIGALYIDTVVEPWAGFYSDTKMSPGQRTNYALRETLLMAKRNDPGGVTAVSTCGANPGMVSWLAKRAMLDLAKDLNYDLRPPESRNDWGRLARRLGIKGIQIAERDTQRSGEPKPLNVFVNTWSVDGFVSESLQPAELGWGTHERWMPSDARTHEAGCRSAIYLLRPGAATKVRSWCPTPGAQHGLLVTHNEAISLSDYFTVRENGAVVYRPTCHYAYHPADDAMLSVGELLGAEGRMQAASRILDETEIVDGIDELGVLLYGHANNAYWYGSQLSIEEARRLAPHQNATGLQVSSAVIAGMAWALENPTAGIVEADEMDFDRCLQIQKQYLGTLRGYYTDWHPLTGRPGIYDDDVDTADPWQFKNVLVR